MKVFVQRVTEVTEAAVLPIPTVSNPRRTTVGQSSRRLDVELVAISESKEDEAAWAASVGKTLTAFEQDLAPREDWFVRCTAVYSPENAPMERCFYPSLESPEWYMHEGEHQSRHYCWGYDEVREIKEDRRSEHHG